MASLQNNMIWFWIALIEAVVIIFLMLTLVWRQMKKSKRPNSPIELQDARHIQIDMADVLMSINSAGELYNKLSRICHPDLFTGNQKYELALDIFQEVSKNKRNYKKLKELENRIDKELKQQT